MRILTGMVLATAVLLATVGVARADEMFVCDHISDVGAIFAKWRKSEMIDPKKMVHLGPNGTLGGCHVELLSGEPKYWVSGEKFSLPYYDLNTNLWILSSRPGKPFAITAHVGAVGWDI